MVQTDAVFPSSITPVANTYNPGTARRSFGKAKGGGKGSQTASSSSTPSLSSDERVLLKVISSISAPILSHTRLNSVLQDLKTALYNKDYALAFGSLDLPVSNDGGEDQREEEENRAELWRQAYVARWVPGRALLYRQLLEEIDGAGLSADSTVDETVGILVLGGGSGSESLALASVLSSSTIKPTPHVDIHIIDNAPWGTILRNQHTAALAQYTSLDPASFSFSFTQADLLSLPSQASIDFKRTRLVLLCFTISELFLQSRTATLQLLQYINSSAQSNTTLVVVESASLGEIEVGKAGRKYQLGMFVDHLLGEGWTKEIAEESRWFRNGDSAKDAYPLKVENTRVVLRVYRKK